MGSDDNDLVVQLDIICQDLKNCPWPADYKSIEHVIIDSLLLSGIYGLLHPPKKALMIRWPPILPLAPRSSQFRLGELLPWFAGIRASRSYLQQMKRQYK